MAASEPLYAGEQINIPPAFPDLLKQMTKAAIKSQPENPYTWALQYFSALNTGRIPVVGGRAADEAPPVLTLESLVKLVLQVSHGTRGP